MPGDGYALADVLPASGLLALLEESFGALLSHLEVVDARFTAVEPSATRALSDAALGEMAPEDSPLADVPETVLPALIDLSALPPEDLTPEALASGATSSRGVYRMHLVVSLDAEVVLAVPGLDWASVVVSAQQLDATVEFSRGAFTVTLSPTVVVRLQRGVLVPMRQVAAGNGTRLEPDPVLTSIDLAVTPPSLMIDDAGRVTVAGQITADLPVPVMIGDSGIIIRATNIGFDLSATSLGLLIGEARVLLPDGLPLPPGIVVAIRNARLDAAGFSGAVSLDLDLAYDAAGKGYSYLPSTTGGQPAPATLFGLPGGVRHIGLSLERNTLTACDVNGEMLVPYFDEPVAVALTITPAGDVHVTLSSTDGDGVTLTKDEILALTVRSLQISQEGATSAVVLSGSLQPMLMSSDGLAWPRFDITDLYIDSTGKFRIKEAWLDLTDLAPLDLWGFRFELSRVGLGFEDARGRLWLDLSGSLRLIEQIPVGLGVEGFRLTWPLDLLEQVGVSGPPTLDQIAAIAEQIDVEFAGIYLFYGVPGSVEFEGLIRFFKNAQVVGFAGDVALRVPASGFGAEAGLMVGMNMETPPYPFLYVYFGVELPAGIPLGQSGLALKGALGLFGLNVAPDKTPEQNWYYDWYKRGPIVGAHPTNKWTNARDALALGVGVTITTADGYVKGTRGLLVLALPGPLLIIEGRALLLNGLQPNAEPPLRALAVFDGRAGTVQFNVEAEATLVEDMVQAHGMLEAFFDFSDLTNWHLFLGQNEPRDRRIRADLLKLGNGFLFKADAYLMLDMVGADTLRSRMGMFVGFKPEIPDIGPLHVDFEATIEGDGVVTVRPEQFSGDVAMSANIGLSTLGFSAQLTAHGDVATEGPDPFKVDATLTIELDPPWPLDPVEAELHFSWQSAPHPVIEPPLAEVVVDSRLSPAGGTPPDASRPEARRFVPGTEAPFDVHSDAGTLSFAAMRARAEASPVVHVDATPTLVFGHLMNSTIASFARHPDGVGYHYDVGLVRFTPSVTAVRFYEHRKRDPFHGDASDWTLVGSSEPSDAKPMPGVWLCESDPASPQAPAPRRLLLWGENPLARAGLALGAGYTQFLGALSAGRSHAERLLEDYPSLMRCERVDAREVCVDFDDAAGTAIAPGGVWMHEGLRFHAGQRPVEVRTIAREVRGAAPSLDPGRRRAVWQALRAEATAFRDFRRVTSARIKTWAARLSAADRARMGRRHPQLDWLWEWLFPPMTAHNCLWSGGYFDVQFPSMVRAVRVRLCEPAKWETPDLRARTRARRAPRTLGELADARKAAGRAEERFDPRACRHPVTVSVTATDTEWRIESADGFDCLSFIRLGQILVDEICYVTAEEDDRSAAAHALCHENATRPTAPPPLRPGAYYRLEVTTDVDAALNLDALPFDRSNVLGAVLVETYQTVMDALGFGDGAPPKTFREAAFFQTDAPPANLRPYVKWSAPAHGAPRFFRGDDVAVRFVRQTMRAMFPDDIAPLRIVLRDADGRLVDDHETVWQSASSATLFPEERVWADHRVSLGWSPAPPQVDDVLVARRDASPPLAPRKRYEMLIATGRRSEPVRDASVAFSSTFTTSAYVSFADLVASCTGPVPSVTALARPTASAVAAVSGTARRLARRQWEFDRAQVDYRFERLLDGRQGLEVARLRLRRERADHEAAFRRLAESLSDLVYGSVPTALSVRVLRDRTTGAAFGLWVGSPEPLEMRAAVLADPERPQSPVVDTTGRVTLALARRTSGVQAVAVDVLADADGGTIIVLASNGATLAADAYELTLTYRRDLGDQAANIDHAYDRPVEMRRGLAEDERGTIRFIIA